MEFSRTDAKSVLGYQMMVESRVLALLKTYGVKVDPVELTSLITQPLVMLFSALDGKTLDFTTVQTHILAELNDGIQDTMPKPKTSQPGTTLPKPGTILPKDLSPRDFSPGGRFEGDTDFDHGEPPR